MVNCWKDYSIFYQLLESKELFEHVLVLGLLLLLFGNVSQSVALSNMDITK